MHGQPVQRRRWRLLHRVPHWQHQLQRRHDVRVLTWLLHGRHRRQPGLHWYVLPLAQS